MAVVCAVSVLEMLRCSGLMRSESSASGSPSASSSAVGSVEPLAEPFDDGPLRRGGVRRRVAEQRRERAAHARAGQHRVHGQLADADPQLYLLEREAPVLGEAGDVARHEEQGGRFRPGQRQRVLAEGAPGQVAGGGAELHAEEDGPERQGELPEQAAEARRAFRIELAQIHGGRDGRRALLLRVDHRLEDAAVRLEHPEAPLAGPDRLEGDAAAARGRPDAGRLGHVQLGHAGQLLERDAHERVRALVLAPVGGDAVGEGAGRLEPVVAGAGARPDDLEQVAQEAAHRVVGIARTEDAHPRML